jgi:hypothetical protein
LNTAVRKKAPSIGTERESSLHRALKYRYSGENGETEIMADDFVCDARTGNGELVEVQTGSFKPLREKIKILSRKNKIRIIYPIIIQKHIELYDARGTLVYRRKSPRKGSPWDLFKALLYAPGLAGAKNIVIELACVDVLEKRIDDGKGSWRRKGISIEDKSLLLWHESIVLEKLKDYRRFIPFKKDETFTTRDFKEKTKINIYLAQKCLYTLDKMGLVERMGKRGRSIVYKKTVNRGNQKPTRFGTGSIHYSLILLPGIGHIVGVPIVLGKEVCYRPQIVKIDVITAVGFHWVNINT